MPHKRDIKPRSTIMTTRPRGKKPSEREIMKTVAEELRREREREKNRKRSDKRQRGEVFEGKEILERIFRKGGLRKA